MGHKGTLPPEYGRSIQPSLLAASHTPHLHEIPFRLVTPPPPVHKLSMCILKALHPFCCSCSFLSVDPHSGSFVFQLLSTKLPYCRENVCLAYGQEWSVYAVGSQAHVSFLDPRQPSHNVKSVCSRERGSGKADSWCISMVVASLLVRLNLHRFFWQGLTVSVKLLQG